MAQSKTTGSAVANPIQVCLGVFHDRIKQQSTMWSWTD